MMIGCKNQYLVSLLPLLILFMADKALPQSISWEQTSGPIGGSVYSLAVNQSGKVFAGSYVTGVFASTNAGAQWIHTSVPDETISAIAVSPNGFVFAGGGSLVYRTADGGITWEPLQNGLDDTGISAIVVNESGFIFAGSFGSRKGVFRSTDNGDSWSQMGLPDTAVVSITINPAGKIYAGTYLSGLWSSTNNGGTWTQTTLATSAWVTSLVVVGSNNIFAGLYANRLHRSVDNGSSWLPVGPAGVTVNALSVNSSNHVFAASIDSGVYRSTNYGSTWGRVGLAGLYLTSVAIDSIDDIYVGTIAGGSTPGGSAGGVYRSTDNGESWFKVGIPNTTIPTLTTSGLAGPTGSIFAGVDSVVFRTTDNGDTWQRTGSMPHLELTPFAIKSLYTSTSTFIFAGSSGSGIYRTMNEGASWVQVGAENETIYSFAENKSGHMYASGNTAVYLSLDGGSNWAATSGVIPGNWLSSLAIAPNGQLFVAMVNRFASTHVFSSTDEGQTWLPSGLTSDPVMALLDDGNGVLFAGCASFFGSGGGVFRSTDGGAIWEEVSSGLSSKDIRALVRNSLGHIFAGTGAGVFRTTNNGDVWEELNTGLTSPSIQSLSLNVDGVLFAGTFTGGVFKTVASTTSVDETGSDFPYSYALEQNYPNPFNPTTKIGFRVSGLGDRYVSLKVFDLLGREVATLVNERMMPGHYERTFDGSGLGSGVYFYRLAVNGFTETKKFVLLR